jgi:hypothetical protein
LKEKNYRFSDDSPPIEEKSNDPQEISFDERDSFSEKGNYKKVDIVQNVKSIVPHSTKQQTSEQTIFKPAQVYQTQVKTNNSEKLENILNTIENNKNKNINNNSIKSTNNDKAEKENTQSKSKSPQKSVSQKEDLPNLKQREVIVNKEEEEKVEEISQYEMRFPEIYHGKLQRSSKLIKQEVSNDGKILKIFENNKKEVIFPSGMRKEIYSDGYTIVFFGNKDIKQVKFDLFRPSLKERLFIILQSPKQHKLPRLTVLRYSNSIITSLKNTILTEVKRLSKLGLIQLP